MGVRVLVTIIVLVAIAAAVLAVLPLFSRFGSGPPVPHPRTNLKMLWLAVMMYQRDTGSFPAHPRGPSYALYLLKDYLDGDPFLLTAPYGEADVVPQPSFDDKQQRVLGSHFYYLNDPCPADGTVVILAELPGINPKYRYYLTSGGVIDSIDARASPLATAPLVGLRRVGGKLLPLPAEPAGPLP